jgi:hypothetical protein
VQWINPAAFANPAFGTYGNFTRNSIFGPGLEDVDLSLFKNTPITERINTQFRVEMFNLFNRLNLANPGPTQLGNDDTAPAVLDRSARPSGRATTHRVSDLANPSTSNWLSRFSSKSR